jgi:adenylate cyclase
MSDDGTPLIHYEVYTLGGQRWTLHARFGQGERDDAIDEARSVERTLGLAAKVIRETYYPARNASEEQTIYAGDLALRNRPAAAKRARGRGQEASSGGGDAAIPEFNQRGPARPAGGSMGNLLKLLLIVGGAFTISGAVTGFAQMFLGKLPDYGIGLPSETGSLILFTTFVVSFLSTALPLAVRLLNWDSGAERQPPPPKVRRPVAAARPVPPPPVAAKPEAPPPPAPDELDAEAEDIEWGSAEEHDEPLPPIEEEAEDASEAGQDAAKDQEEKGEESEAEEKLAGEDAADGNDRNGATPSAEACQIVVMRFLSGLLSDVKKTRPTLDAYNKFGIYLLLAGAIDMLGSRSGLDQDERRGILVAAIEVMGTKAETARAFTAKYEEYLMEPRYLAMVQAGRAAMEVVQGGGEVPEDLAKVFDVWNKPTQTVQASPRIVTILFTDMVGSTDLTQARGDQAAQHLVRRHNSIVRAALAELSGKEIKHTGDGIMASFASAANAVEAAVAIQRSVADHNEKLEDQQLHLRIGLNSGEPIEEEDDLFGSTVQLAARVCAKTEPDGILCTNVVRELSAGKTHVFVAQGVHELKGFKDPVSLYTVLWDPREIAALPAPEGEFPDEGVVDGGAAVSGAEAEAAK